MANSEALPVRAELVRLPAPDGVALAGICWRPEGAAKETAIALFPGTGSEFYNPLFTFLGPRLAAMGWATLALNRRDHGQFFGFFTLAEAAMDQRVGIDWLCAQGARQVALGGHSYGTVTAPWYVAETDDPRVPAMLLYAALGDLRPASRTIVGGEAEYERIVAEARAHIEQGRGDEAFLIPPMVPGGEPLVHTWRVFLDKRGPESEAAPAELLRRTGARPALALRDPADPYPATLPPAQEMLEAANPNLTYVLLEDRRGGRTDPEAHYFSGREEEALAATIEFLAAKGLDR